jgi:nitric oxide reductase large subunit
VALALLGIALGEMLFYTLAVANEYNLTMTAAAGEVLGIAGDILTDSEVYLPYGLSALGAVLGLVGVLRRR